MQPTLFTATYSASRAAAGPEVKTGTPRRWRLGGAKHVGSPLSTMRAHP